MQNAVILVSTEAFTLVKDEGGGTPCHSHLFFPRADNTQKYVPLFQWESHHFYDQLRDEMFWGNFRIFSSVSFEKEER